MLFFLLLLPLHIKFSYELKKKVVFKQLSNRSSVKNKKYEPNWQSLDQRPIPNWFDKAKVGIFIHWGIYSVPAFGTTSKSNGYAEWFLREWKSDQNPAFVRFMKDNYPPGFEYSDFVTLWKGEFFNATQWADLVEASGAKYFVVTSKHHDGFTLWPSNVSWNWNSVDNGPHKDILGELAQAVRAKKSIHFGLYYSLYEWYNRLYLLDKSNNFATHHYVDDILLPQMYDHVLSYQPEYIWSDGDWEANYTYWKSEEFLAWLYNDSPVRDTVVVNDRWGIGTNCKHGDIKTCGIDRFNPHKLQNFKWENAMTLDRYSWGFRRNAVLSDYLTINELLQTLVETVSYGGNLVVNIGPTADGRIVPIFQERLLQMGSWLKVNGEAIYESKIWRVQNDTSAERTWFTQKSSDVYAIILDWPTDGYVRLYNPIPTYKTVVTLLGMNEKLDWKLMFYKQGLIIDVRSITHSQLPCQWAWTFKLVGVN
ncbi:alpha-L-fucosidase isoform X1 [Hydra vulgaris]|uniref:alpha-L-fucosidase n=1 Tax=Hydra vulgaris TaxID=6087 RepID=A0ABM4D3F6_HYDVU